MKGVSLWFAIRFFAKYFLKLTTLLVHGESLNELFEIIHHSILIEIFFEMA
jgi:hypothetical protein